MATVFISYSRTDIEFAKRLTAELKKCELDFWIDWEDISPTVDWWNEIEKGIEQADAFLFLISPDSAKSAVCGREINTAVKNGKRLIPIVVRDTKGDEAPAQLARLNWIFFREHDDFHRALDTLISAIHTDFDWVQIHRRLQVKALEWAKNNKENSLLLRGRDLQNAELQLATNSSKEPQPTDLQRQYVFKSKEVTDRQRRFITRISIASAIVMTVLTVLAFIQLNISRAQNLGAQAQVAFVQQNYNTALLYAYQSNLIHKNNAAESVLSQIAYKNFVLGKQLTGYSDENVSSVAWSADGQLASATDSGVTIWDLKTRKPVQILDVRLQSFDSVAWSADGQLASGTYGGTVIIWDLKTGQPAQTLKGHTDFVRSLAWSADGRLASGSDDNTVIIWDLKTGQPAQILKGHTNHVLSVAWSADGQLASISEKDGTIIIWDLKTGQAAQTLEGGGSQDFASVAWSADGQLASISGGDIIIWDLKSGKPAQTLRGGLRYFPTCIAWSAGGQLASGSYDGRVMIWDPKTGQPAQTLEGGTGGIVYGVAWSAGGQLASASNNELTGTVTVWNLKKDQPLAQTLMEDPNPVNSVAWSANGQLASNSLFHTIIWDLKTGQPAQTLQDGGAYSLAWSTNGQLASAYPGNIVIIWDPKMGESVQVLKGHTDTVTSVAWSPDGQLASGSLDNTVIIWDLKTGQPALTLRGHTNTYLDGVKKKIFSLLGQDYTVFFSSVGWSVDGRLATGSSDGTVTIWDLKTGKPAQTLGRFADTVSSVAWSADGQLASGSYDGTVIIWDLKTGQPARTLKGHTDFVRSVAWSANGQLASGSNDGTVIIWDIKTGQPNQTLKEHKGSVASVAWSVDGQLASGSDDHTIKITRADLTGGDPCDKIPRNMTIQEWMNYEGMLYIYRPACPNLYYPTLHPLQNFFSWITFTWMGRAIILVLLSGFLTVSFFILRFFYRLAARLLQNVQIKREA